jgi:hypothetical protein
MPLKMTSKPYSLTPYFQPSKLTDVRNSEIGRYTCTSQHGTEKVSKGCTRCTTYNLATFAKNQKYEHGGQLEVEILILFYGGDSWIVACRQVKFDTLKDEGYTCNFFVSLFYLTSFWIWRWCDILRLCWDKHLATPCRILQFCELPYLSKLFNFLCVPA